MSRVAPAVRTIGFALAAAVCLPLAAQCQRRQEAPPPKNYLAELQAAAAQLSQRHGVTILVDPVLHVGKPVPLPNDARESLESSLNALSSLCMDAALRRIYLMKSRSAAPEAAKLAASIRALEGIEASSLVVAKSTSATAFSKEIALPEPTREVDLSAQGFDPKPIYLLYAKVEPVKSWEERNVELQQQALECMLQMSPEKLTDEMAKGIEVARGLPSKDKWRLMGLPVMAAMFATWFPRAAKEKAERGMP